MSRDFWRQILSVILLSLVVPAAAQPLEGKLVSIGSDTLGTLSSLWAEMMTERHPDVLVQVRAISSGAAPTALVQGTADIGPMSRPMSPQERSAFIRRYGYAPTAVPVASDTLAVFVHRDNPLDSITDRQLDRIFSATRRCGGGASIRQWGDLGLQGDWSDRSLSVYGRTTASGTYSVFRRQILCGGDFSPHLNRLVGSSAIVRAVAQDRSGIGYASAGYLSASVKQLRVADELGLSDRSLSRRLFLYINRRPGEALEPALAAFMDLALSSVGQREVMKSGYEPLDEGRLAELRELLGLPRG